MKRSFYTVLICALIWTFAPHTARAQKSFDPETATVWDRLYFGGNFGLSFGNITYVDVSPLVGYMINQDLSAGFGVTYQYFKRKASNPVFDYETNVYGGRLFARHNIGSQFFAYTEYESLSLEFYRQVDGQTRLTREWVPGLLIGGGMFLPLGKRSGVNIMALYNVLYDNAKSPYPQPYVIRVGLTL